MAKPDFIGSGGSGTPPKQPFENRPQKSGGMVPGEGKGIEGFENRPQKSGESEADPKSKTPGGKLPFGPSKQPPLPAKFSGG